MRLRFEDNFAALLFVTLFRLAGFAGCFGDTWATLGPGDFSGTSIERDCRAISSHSATRPSAAELAVERRMPRYVAPAPRGTERDPSLTLSVDPEGLESYLLSVDAPER